MAEHEAKIIFTGKDNTGDSFKLVGNKLKGLNTDVSALAKVLAGAAVAVGGFAIAFGVSAVKSAMESEKVLAQLNARLESTKGIAGVTAKAATELATSLQAVTTASDEDVLSVENMLLTFTNIHSKVFPEVTKAVLDMATAMNNGVTPSMEQLSATAIQVGKAMQDPIEGATALQRVGVRLTDAQKELIKTLMDAGDVMGAQKIILGELTTEFGGSAVAAAQTFEGSLKMLGNQFDEMKETIGVALIEAIRPFIGELSQWAANPDVQKKIKDIATSIGEFVKVALPVAIETIRIWISAFNGVVEVLGTIIYNIDRAITAITRFKNAVSGVIEGAGRATGSVISSVVKTITGKAGGGSVYTGGSYIVGERGPELFTPATSGFITPNGAMGRNITVNISGNTLLDSYAAEKIGDLIISRLKLSSQV